MKLQILWYVPTQYQDTRMAFRNSAWGNITERWLDTWRIKIKDQRRYEKFVAHICGLLRRSKMFNHFIQVIRNWSFLSFSRPNGSISYRRRRYIFQFVNFFEDISGLSHVTSSTNFPGPHVTHLKTCHHHFTRTSVWNNTNWIRTWHLRKAWISHISLRWLVVYLKVNLCFDKVKE